MFSTGQALTQGFACRWNECSFGKSPDQPNQQPMSVHRRAPVVAAVECGHQFSGRLRIRIAVQRMADVIQVAISERLLMLSQHHFGSPEERNAIADALNGLAMLERELKRNLEQSQSDWDVRT